MPPLCAMILNACIIPLADIQRALDWVIDTVFMSQPNGKNVAVTVSTIPTENKMAQDPRPP